MNRAAVAIATLSLAAGVCAVAPAAAAPVPAASQVSTVADTASAWYWKLMGTYSLLGDCQNAGVSNTSTGAWDSYSCEPKSYLGNPYWELWAGFND